MVARWEPHPLTRKTARMTLAMGIFSIALLAVLALRHLSPLAIAFHFAMLVAVFGLSLARFVRRRSEKLELLQVLHGALTPYELGEADLEASAFRADRARREPAIEKRKR